MVPAVHEGRAMKNLSLASLAVLALAVQTARAQAPGAEPAPPAPVAPGAFVTQPPAEQPAPAPAPEAPMKTVAITVSPFHMFIPMIELTGEFRVGRKLGIAVIAGAGGIRDEVTDRLIRLYEGGASVRYYVIGSFRHGMQIGGELLYVKANTDDTMVEVRARGLGISPFVGYKWQHRSGFTIDTQLGVSFMTARGDSDAGASKEESKVGALLNLNVGWSI